MIDRALVLGGGGSAGNAWTVGIIAGLFDAGIDVTRADLVLGTSAGSTAAAQITSSAHPTKLFADICAAVSKPGAGGIGPDQGGIPRPSANHMERTAAIFAAAADAADFRRRVCAAALEADAASDGTAQARWRAAVTSRLPSQDWPEQRLHIVALDAGSGEPVVFARDSGVELRDAVAASTANGFGVPPYSIGEKRYIDGGYPSAENAVLAAGYCRVLVMAPFGGRSRAPPQWGVHLAAQVEELRAGGSNVETIFPDRAARSAFGVNMMDLSVRPASAQAGYDHGISVAPRISEFWR